MRRSLLIFLLLAIVFVTFALHSVSTLLSLLLEDASGDAILKAELPGPNSNTTSHFINHPPIIPRIIHQTYINNSIPQRWLAAQRSCIDLHPDYEYMLWTDEKSYAFIEKEYPWFLSTFAGYKHNIQRADSIRYFVLAHYGGIYIDLDDGCKRRLDPLLSFPAWLRRTVPTGISNDAMGSTPQHPFFLRVIESLQGANRAWVLPYITIMASTGPLFLSVLWKKWMGEHSDSAAFDPETWNGRVRVLMPEEYKGYNWSFFEIYKGNSWHGDDAKLIFWMGKNWLLLTIAGFLLAALIAFVVWWLYGKLVVLGKRRGLLKAGGASPGMSSKVGPRTKRPLWRQWVGHTGKGSYELVEQHDA